MTTQADILAEYATEIQNLTEAVRLATPDPKDQIRLLCDLASFGLDATQPAGVNLAPAARAKQRAQQATQALCRRAALTSLASAVALRSPASSNEAAATLRQVKALYDAEILNAGDLGDMDTYSELRSLRSAVVADLQERGMKLPEIIEVKRAVSMPALVLAYDLYEDAGRGDELVRRVNCPHPLFFPTSFEALSS